jgi:hypothetical protein
MARVVRGLISVPFRTRLADCGVAPASPIARAFGRTLAAQSEAETLPEAGDATTLLEEPARGVSTLVHVRRVAGYNLWIWFRLNRAGDVVLVTVENEPP